ncbi:hypothetical protein ABZP36_000500 [Zizania latifolia]
MPSWSPCSFLTLRRASLRCLRPQRSSPRTLSPSAPSRNTRSVQQQHYSRWHRVSASSSVGEDPGQAHHWTHLLLLLLVAASAYTSTVSFLLLG